MKHTYASWRAVFAGAAALLLVGAGCGGGITSAPSSTEKPEEKAAAPQGQKTELQGAMVKAMYFDAETEVAVKNVTTNFMAENATAPDEGKQYVRVEVEIKNTGKESYSANPVSYRLKTANKELVNYAWILEPSMQDFLKDTQLAPGDSVSGALYYEVPASETLETLSFVYMGAVSKDGLSDEKEYEIPFKQ